MIGSGNCERQNITLNKETAGRSRQQILEKASVDVHCSIALGPAKEDTWNTMIMKFDGTYLTRSRASV